MPKKGQKKRSSLIVIISDGERIPLDHNGRLIDKSFEKKAKRTNYSKLKKPAFNRTDQNPLSTTTASICDSNINYFTSPPFSNLDMCSTNFDQDLVFNKEDKNTSINEFDISHEPNYIEWDTAGPFFEDGLLGQNEQHKSQSDVDDNDLFFQF